MKMAGMSQLLTHRDPTHAGDALGRLNNLRREGILCDLTILVEGREYKAHKAVMAACSDYFLNAICGGKTTATVTSGDHGYVTVDLDHVTLRGFAPLLEYAYTSSLQVNASDVIDVLSAASYMQMFKVANACSEFMRSNIMWAQSLPRLASLPGMNHALMNGSKHAPHGSLSPSSAPTRGSGLPPDVSNILKATSAMSAAASRAALGQPPLLIPIHSMPYDVGFHHLAASMAGTQSLLSRAGVPAAALTASGVSSSPPRNSSQSPASTWPAISSHSQGPKESPSPKTNGYPEADSANYPSRSLTHVNGSSGRKSFAVKIESRSDDEDSRASANGIDSTNDQVKSGSPTGSEPVEDSWQALQKLYSIRMTESQSHRQHPYLPRPERMDERESSRSPNPRDMGDPNNNEGSPYRGDGSPINHGVNINSNNNNNSNNSKANQIAEFMSKMANKTNGLAVGKRSPDLLSNDMGAGSPGSVNRVTAAALSGAMQSAIMQQQQLLAAQQNGSEPPKMIDLPVMPPNGQYMSVRRRTLQSTVPKPHQCQICGSRFTRFHNLKQHIKLHSGIKPYECDECGKRFTRNYTLRLHKMKHVGIRNFRCGTCEAAFTSLGEFRAHLRITMHSQVPGGPPLDCGSPAAGNSEPEDLSSPLGLGGGHNPAPTMSKYPGYDATMLSFQRGMLGGDRNSMLSAALGGAMLMRGARSVGGGSSIGAGSPQLSERSISPQDLTTKASNRSPSYEEKMESEYSPQISRGDEHDVTTSDEYNHSRQEEYMDDAAASGDQENVTMVDGSTHGSSPAHCRTESPASDAGPVAENIADRDTDQDERNEEEMNNNPGSNSNTKSKSNNDQPISLVVNASA